MHTSSIQHRSTSWAWWATAMIAALLCVLTLSPQTASGAGSNLDKAYHFIGFGVLALPLCLAYPRRVWTVVLGVTVFGGMIELLQPFVGRGAEWLDLLSDALGGTAAALFARVLRR